MEDFLLKFLCCPETGQSVRFANQTELKALNTHIGLQSVINRSGQTINSPLSAALIRQDSQVAYPIRDDIPLLLVEEAIATPSESSILDHASTE